SSADQFTFIKFDIQGTNGVITNAILRLHVSDGSDQAGSIHRVSNNYSDSNTPWQEGELNWKNAPQVTSPAISFWGAVSKGDVIEYDLSGDITSNGAYSFAIQNTSSNTVKFDSKEGTNPPELVIEFLSEEKTEPSPSITSFTPASGQSGSNVSIIGANLTNVNQVTFGGTSAVTFNVTSDTLLVAEVPTGAITGKIKIIGPHGTAGSATDFTIKSMPAPPALTLISHFSPSSGRVGSQVTIAGQYFNQVASIEFNGIASTKFTNVSDTEIIATVPVNATSGPIRVITAAGADTSANDFTIAEPTKQASIAFQPIADTYVRSDKTTKNYGDSDQLRVKKSSSLQRTYFKFDLTELTVPPATAVLKLSVS
ncbi:DNRLRE domain-containing protein, partial [bacterium]|nr:DNRLRE domain-containing protein [bacterium]